MVNPAPFPVGLIGRFSGRREATEKDVKVKRGSEGARPLLLGAPEGVSRSRAHD